MPDSSQSIQAQLRQAVASKQAVKIINGNSLTLFSQHNTTGEAIDVSQHTGIIHYAPDELVLQVRAGTSLKEINQTLAQHNQQLPFKPPILSDNTTIGGIVACGLSGSSMPFLGSVKDAILGIRLLNGLAENCVFGGTVIKNVAGFDLARLQVGAFGQYGIILDIAIKVIPQAQQVSTLTIHCEQHKAIQLMNQYRQQASPISALAYHQQQLYMQLSGYPDAINCFKKALAQNLTETDNRFWQQLESYTHPIFNCDIASQAIYKVNCAVNHAASPLGITDDLLIDWAGGLRWIKSDKKPVDFDKVQLFKSDKQLRQKPTLLDIYKQKLKLAFDPYQLINCGH